MQFDQEFIGDNEKIPVTKPEMREGTQVYLNNKEHPFNLEQGEVIARDHRQYRVRFVSQNPTINGKCLWLPEHWVDPLPKELRSNKN